MVVVLMGVVGAGKTTVGKLLARKLGWNFYDADEFHPARNIKKMATGIPLSERDRRPWLFALKRLVTSLLVRDSSAVLACSALRNSYRRLLAVDKNRVLFVYLKVHYKVARARLKERIGHFADERILKDQFETLEEPGDAIVTDANLPLARVVRAIVERLPVSGAL